ncbi:RNA polymerase sigma-70 factor [Pedobacter nyackensis]|uniref:RNA polymerase sigma-70 factor, ECF subfamily n=1 Tax=Pedobacter nyackensis TaxID=475255 RepID=A0A1W2B0B3_9SPHI|nr:RNA polymerase sigma-70 factor [Pedobacter nyackensis]SMC66376.1 RNA polymerase sigma-70 factor, ECF subfamily [Pedobacter nyackensis]
MDPDETSLGDKMIQFKRKENLIDEKAVLLLVSAGSAKAFSQLFHHYSPKVFQYALKIVKSDTLAEEIVQEVFVKIWNLEEQLVAIENLDAYLRVLTRNHTLKVLRRIALEVKTNRMMVHTYQEDHNDTEEYIIFKDSEKILNQAIEKLPAQQRMVYSLCHQEGLKYEEVAERLNISKLTVKTHMQHALRFLRNYVSTHTDIAVLVILMTFLSEK